MAAGLGFKTFLSGDVLSAGDVNGYLMQGINVFATTAARDAAITSPQEGQFAFTKDTNSLWYYDSTAWVASGATGDIEGVTAGIGISGGGTSGTVTVTNSMATAIDAKGDLVAGTGADAFSRLAVGANATVLTADSAEATGMKWATPTAASNFSLIGTGTLTGAATITVSGLSNLNNIYVMINEASSASASSSIQLRLNADSGSNYDYFYYDLTANSTYSVSSIFDANASLNQAQFLLGKMSDSASSRVIGYCKIEGGATAGQKMIQFATGGTPSSSNNSKFTNGSGVWDNSSTITSISLISTIGNFDGGTFLVYGA